jgi:hypothetical protein
MTSYFGAVQVKWMKQVLKSTLDFHWRKTAAIWLRALGCEMSLMSIIEMFKRRFFPANVGLKAITDLGDAKIADKESLLTFLDRVRMISVRGGVSEDVLVASALKAVPRPLAQRVLIEQGGRVTWERLYETCRLWELLYCEERSLSTWECDAVKRNQKGENKMEVFGNKEFRSVAPNQCRNCLKFGHWARECRFKNAYKQKTKKHFNNKRVYEVEKEESENNVEGNVLNKDLFIYSASENFGFNSCKEWIRVGDVNVKGLIDTGADVCLARKGLLKEKYMKQTNSRLLTADS